MMFIAKWNMPAGAVLAAAGQAAGRGDMAMRGIWMIVGLLGLALARPALAQVPEPLPPEAVEALPVATAPAQVPPPTASDAVPALPRARAEARRVGTECASPCRDQWPP